MEIFMLGNSLVTEKAIYKCSHGKNGCTDDKIEGDMMSPNGQFYLRRAFYRADKTHKPETLLPIVAITTDMGWCDDPSKPEYNTLIKLPFDGSHEKMWREDDLYDLVIEVGYNDEQIVPGLGSAIFIHCIGPEYSGTAGCIGLNKDDLHNLIKDLSVHSTITIQS